MEDEPDAAEVRRVFRRAIGEVRLGSPRSLRPSTRTWRALLACGLLVRLFGLPLSGTVDFDVWKTWSYAASKDVSIMYGVGGNPPVRGLVTWGTRQTTVDYPPAALYGLAVVGRAYRAFDPAFSDSTAFTVALKIAILLADAAICAGLLILIRRRYTETAGRVAALLYWLNPAAIMNGAVLGYLDPWAGCAAIMALVAMNGSAFALGGIFLALAALTKPQSLLIAPVVALLLFHRAGRAWWGAAPVAAVAAAITMLVFLAPFARIGALANLRQGVASVLRHDMLSGEASNVWWIVTWLLRASYAAADVGTWAAWTGRVRILGISRFMELGYFDPRPVAAIAAGGVIAWALWRARRADLAVVLAAGALGIHAYFTLAVRVHENHLYFAIPLLAAAAAVRPRLRGPLYLVSAVFALNLFLFHGFGRDFPRPSRAMTIVDATVLLAFVNVGALIWHARRFAAVSGSQQAAGPAAVYGEGDPGDIRRGG